MTGSGQNGDHLTFNIKNAVMPVFDKKELNYVLFNDALNTLYLRFYGVEHTVKDH